MLRIRRSTAADGDRIVGIWRDAVDATHHFLSPADRAAIEAEVREFLPQLPLWLAVDAHDRAVGFMGLSDGEIDSLFVDPACHGRGVGRRLVEHALAANAVLTVDVNEANAQAIGFYERMGFVAVGRSAVDGQGRAYPLIHMRLGGAPAVA